MSTAINGTTGTTSTTSSRSISNNNNNNILTGRIESNSESEFMATQLHSRRLTG